MKTQTMAQALLTAQSIDELWNEVDEVKRLDDGSDLYTYPDGSQLKVTASSGVVSIVVI